MTLYEFIESSGVGTQKRMALAVGATEADISNFKTGKRVTPVKYCKGIERFTNKAVTVKELRPNDWHTYWD